MSRYINPDSDGKFYNLNDMVKADCHDCEGCSDCCEGMGDSILLDPYDIYQFNNAFISFAELMSHGLVALSIDNGLVIPHIKMSDFTDRCPFLEEGRCSIHQYRPGMCRLFPLGRDYSEGKLEYILLEKNCPKTNRTKIKVDKWIGIEPSRKYYDFLQTWHDFRRQIAEILAESDSEQAQELSMRILNTFYVSGYSTDKDFYDQFETRIDMYKRAFEL